MLPQQFPKIRTLATVSDAPLDKKVEMTNWEKVWLLGPLILRWADGCI
jgi:hypothetical protein